MENEAFLRLKQDIPQIIKGGLNKALRVIFHEAYLEKHINTDDDENKLSFAGWLSMCGFEDCVKPNFCPDATYLDRENKKLYIYEIENTYPVSEKKQSLMWFFAHDLYDILMSYHIQVIAVGRRGVGLVTLIDTEKELV